MSISSLPNSAFTKAENFNRRSTNNETTTDKSQQTQHSRSPFEVAVNLDTESRSFGSSDNTAGYGAGCFRSTIPEIDSLANVLATFDAANAAKTISKNSLQQTIDEFEYQFTRVASDKDSFNTLMQTAFGDKYDTQAAETIRQQTLANDFSWMPDIKVVDGATLTDTSGLRAGQTGLGAYNSASDIIYLSKELLAGDPGRVVDILTEEVGHAIDSRVNTSDSAGDEGELFAKLVSGEHLSAAQIQVLRAENDHGTIVVDGERVEVEFFKLKIPNPVKLIKDNLIDPVMENVVEPVVDNVTKPFVNGAETVANGIKGIGGVLSSGVSSGWPLS